MQTDNNLTKSKNPFSFGIVGSGTAYLNPVSSIADPSTDKWLKARSDL